MSKKQSKMPSVRMTDFVGREDLVKFQLDSFNWLIERGLQEVIDEKGSLDIEIPDYSLELGKIQVGIPQVNESGQGVESRYPFECRLRNLTYSAPINLEFIENGEPVDVEIGHLPIMLRSSSCLLHGLDREEVARHWKN